MYRLSCSVAVLLTVLGTLLPAGAVEAGLFDRSHPVNAAREYPQVPAPNRLTLDVNVGRVESRIDRRIFGTNLEWFNEAGGLASANRERRDSIVRLSRELGPVVYRFPGGILADYYDWRDGLGPLINRKVTRHPTDSGASAHLFGSPEYFRFLQDTGGEALITVNAGTGSAADAAAWVDFANNPNNARRAKEGFASPIGVKLWEVGNELYLPGNPTEKKIAVTPEVYSARFIEFADAMRAADPSITVIAIGVAKSHIGPDTEYPDWTEKLLKAAADRIDMIAVHNAYFPMLYKAKQAPVDVVYPALWASPEAVDESLKTLDRLIARYEGKRNIGVAITEWGALYTIPRADPYWVDHVKTMGSGVYTARMLQVFMSHPRVRLANHFKLVDRSYMGIIDQNGQAKVPYEILKLYSRHTGDQRVESRLSPPMSYDAAAIGVMKAQQNVAEVTAIASRDSKSGRVFVNLVNRSMSRVYSVDLKLQGARAARTGEILSISAPEPTAHNGRDIPREWPYKPEFEPYSSVPAGSIAIRSKPWSPGTALTIPPFSVLTLALDVDN